MKLRTLASTGKAVVLIFLSAFVTLSNVYADPPQTETFKTSVETDGTLIPLAARFVETRSQPDETPSQSEWYFVRSDTRIETAREDYAEIWERDERQEITLKRVFHGDRKLIEYTPGELRAQRMLKDWSSLATILDERMLARLEKLGEMKIGDQPAVRYAGRWGDERIEVIWLARQAIPAKLIRVLGETAYALELQEWRSAQDVSWPKVSREQIADYESIDGSDLGDREYDPFVQKVMTLDAARRGGHPHTH